jgi:hypothetical protein
MGERRFRQLRRRADDVRRRAGDPVAPAFGGAVPVTRFPDLFTYPRKRVLTAYLLWIAGGLLGAHRFYLDREGTAVAQFLTGGGLLAWWAVDAFLVPSMVRDYNEDQAAREEEGRPPRALDFLETARRDLEAGASDAGEGGRAAPPAAEPRTAGDPDAGDGSAEPLPAGAVPDWAADRAAGRGRLAADVAVVAFTGLSLGVVSAGTGSYRAAAAVAAVVLAVGFAPELSALRQVPGLRELLRWAARLGLFYSYHDPGGPLTRLARPLLGVVYAPFRSRDRAEAHLYVELGGAFAILFFLVDLVVFGAALAGGEAGLAELPGRWAAAAVLTLVNVYAFASPVGATLFEYVLAGRSHRRVWLLGGTALAALAAGLALP